MIAILDARPGMTSRLRAIVDELAQQVRHEPACSTSPPTRPATPDRFYLYEVSASAAAFDEHLQTQHVHNFLAAVPALSTAQPGSLIQLDEIAIN